MHCRDCSTLSADACRSALCQGKIPKIKKGAKPLSKLTSLVKVRFPFPTYTALMDYLPNSFRLFKSELNKTLTDYLTSLRHLLRTTRCLGENNQYLFKSAWLKWCDHTLRVKCAIQFLNSTKKAYLNAMRAFLIK